MGRPKGQFKVQAELLLTKLCLLGVAFEGTNEELAKDMGVCVRQVRRYLDHLKGLGKITITENRHRLNTGTYTYHRWIRVVQPKE